MSEEIREGALVRYYCTAGKGLETFLTDEVKRKLAAEDVCQMPGKVLFSSSAGINRVIELKSAERLFLLLKKDSPVCLSAHTSPAKAGSVLQSRLLADGNPWSSAVLTWNRLQGELADRKRTTVNTQQRKEGTASEVERKNKSVQRKSTGEEERKEEEEEEGGNVKPRSEGEENGAQTLERKRKRDEGVREGERHGKEETCGETCVEVQTSEKKRKGIDKNEEEEIRVADSGHGKNGEKEGPSHRESAQNVKSAGGKDNTLLQRNTIHPEPPSVPVSFRISCKCTGSLSRCLSTQDVSRVIGVGVSKLLGWQTELKNPLLEVNVYLSDEYCLLGIPLTRLPLANRSYIKTTGLRSTVAWAMASLAQIQPGFTVADPMCGVGTILLEAAQEHKAACFLGMDIDDGQLQKANQNVGFAELGDRIHLLKASSMVLPLLSSSVDAVLCDLPFGRKFGTRENMAANLPLILTEMERVLRIGGTLVLLLSPQLSCLLKKLLAQNDNAPVAKQETNLPAGIKDRDSPTQGSTEQQTFQQPQGVDPSPTQGTDTRSGLQRSPTPPLSSLKHQTTVRVGLGMIDGLIHRYVKIDT